MNELLTGDFNLEIIKSIQSISNPVLDRIAEGVTMMGEESFFIVFVAIIFWCVNKKYGYRLGFTLILSMTINGAIKETLKVPRVFGTDGIRSLRTETATGYSFPSGHTQSTATFWISLMRNIKKKWTHIIGIIFIILVGLSRLYLGVHRPVDVVAAIIFAWISVYIANKIFNYIEKGGSDIVFLIIIIPMLVGLYFFKDKDYYSACGIVIGFLVGYIFESKYIQFTEKSSVSHNIIKFVLGICIVLLVKVVLKVVFPKILIFTFIRYAFIGLSITVGVPLLFVKLKLSYCKKNYC